MARRHHVEPLDGIRLIAGSELIEPFVCIGKLRLKLDSDLRADFVTAAANRGADGGENILGLRAELHLHLADGFCNDALERAAPSRMDGGNRALLGVNEKNRHTIRGLDSEEQARAIGHRGVAAARLCGRRVKHLNNIGMDLFEHYQLQIVRVERRLKAAAIFEHVFPVIPFRKAEIEDFSAVQFADAPRPRAETMDEPGKFGERRNLQDPHTVLYAFRPGAVALNSRALLASAAFFRDCFRGSHNSTSIIGVERGRTGKRGGVLIIGMGVDIAEVHRIQAAIERHGEVFLRRLYTAKEREYCEQFKNKYERYAGRFAAKEAAMKALGTGWRRGVRWVDLEVVREPGGRPTLALAGEAGKIAQQLGVKNIALSITHTESQALAQVIFES